MTETYAPPFAGKVALVTGASSGMSAGEMVGRGDHTPPARRPGGVPSGPGRQGLGCQTVRGKGFLPGRRVGHEGARDAGERG